MIKKSLSSDKESNYIMISPKNHFCRRTGVRGSAPDDGDRLDLIDRGTLGAVPPVGIDMTGPVVRGQGQCPRNLSDIQHHILRNLYMSLGFFQFSAQFLRRYCSSIFFTKDRILNNSRVTINHNLQNSRVLEYKKLKFSKIVESHVLKINYYI